MGTRLQMGAGVDGTEEGRRLEIPTATSVMLNVDQNGSLMGQHRLTPAEHFLVCAKH